MNKGWLVGWWTETSFHPGVGSAIGVIDLPVQRERHTGLPTMQASGIKGSLRRVAEQNEQIRSSVELLFGAKNANVERQAGQVGFTDLRLIAYPMRSLTGGVLWATCPLLLSRFQQDCELIGRVTEWDVKVPAANEAFVSNELKELLGEGPCFLEEYEYAAIGHSWVSTVAQELVNLIAPQKDAYEYLRKKLTSHLVVLSDEEFLYLVSKSTEIHPRIKLSESKASENLWYEETIPRDTLFYSQFFHLPSRKNDSAESIKTWVKSLQDGIVQLGGDESIGRGWFRVRVAPDREGQSL